MRTGQTSFGYDLDGFLLYRDDEGAKTRYDYASRGALLSVSLADGRLIEYVYDPLGRRIAKKIDGVLTEKYLWQGLTRLLAVYDANDRLQLRFEYADGRLPVAMTGENGARSHLFYDPVGSLRLVVDGQGNVVKEIQYDAFGNIVSDSNPGLAIPLGFAGGLHDPDTGLVRFGFRDYDSTTGRWTAKDPIGFAGGDTDLYGYCLNDPVNFIDSNGLYKFLIKQFAQRSTKIMANNYLRHFDAAARRIISAGIGGAAGGAVAGALVGTPALGVGAGPSSLGGAIVGFSGGLLVQTSLEAAGLGQPIEDLTNQIIQNFWDAIVDDSREASPCPK